MGIFVIQHPAPIAYVGTLDGLIAAVRAAANSMTAAGCPVLMLHALYVPADQTCLSVVDADDAATVLEALRRAGSTTARILPALSL